MEAKRPLPRPITCPICTSREVTGRGWPGWIGMIKTARKKKTIAQMLGIQPPQPATPTKVIRYRCKQCGHKFTVERNFRA